MTNTEATLSIPTNAPAPINPLDLVSQSVTLSTGRTVNIIGWGFLKQRAGVKLVSRLLEHSTSLKQLFNPDKATLDTPPLEFIGNQTIVVLEEILKLSLENGILDIEKIGTLGDSRVLLLAIAEQNGWRDFFAVLVNLEQNINRPAVDLEMIQALTESTQLVQELAAEREELNRELMFQQELNQSLVTQLENMTNPD